MIGPGSHKRNPDMNVNGESNMGEVPMKPPNRSHKVVAAEVVEERPVTTENIMEPNKQPTQSGERDPRVAWVGQSRGGWVSFLAASAVFRRHTYVRGARPNLNSPPAILLRESSREGSKILPDSSSALLVTRSLPHGHVAAVDHTRSG